MISYLPQPHPRATFRAESLAKGIDSLALMHLIDDLQAQKPRPPLIIFTENAQEAQRLFTEILWFSPFHKIHLFPDWETLPYDQFSPHPDLISERLTTLYKINQNQCDAVIIPISTALVQLPPMQFLLAHTFMFQQGQKLNLEELKQQCVTAGYSKVNQVVVHGEFSLRGGLIDLFPMGSPHPFRMDLFDDEIENIHTFDVETQRSVKPVSDIHILPAREYPINERGISVFRQNFRELFEGDPSSYRIYRDISHGIIPSGIEWYLPLFFAETVNILSYFPEESVICLHGQLETNAQNFITETQSRYRSLSGDKERPILPPEKLFIEIADFFKKTKNYGRISLPIHSPQLPLLEINRKASEPLKKLQDFIETFSERILIGAESLGRRESLQQTFNNHGIRVKICEDWQEFIRSADRIMLTVTPLHQGIIAEQAIITEIELFPASISRNHQQKTRHKNHEHIIKNLVELRENDPIVHQDYGVGRYRGLMYLDFGDGQTEVLSIEYADGDKLYIPVASLHLISRYAGGPPELAPLHKLGTSQWEKSKKKALKTIRDTAAELLNLYAQRAAKKGHSFQLNTEDYNAFVESFPFEETQDQQSAISAVIEDMQSERPMDRLICGDVGFGKTEIALRSAFIAVMNGYQVAILVPTTLLAEQHFKTFSNRFVDFPIKIAEISRFKTAQEQKLAIQELSEGKIDIIIGTHRLISKDIKFKNLGLIILDEEHRFGVRQKEQLKTLRAEVDVLTLTATPIPRTLSMAMEGLREFSIISTPPQKRLAIKTLVHPYSNGIVYEAVMRELKRGGQVYFLHNEVHSINAMKERLEKLLPTARIAIAHGQLEEHQLEKVMRDFYQQRINVLLCTTIIETGIDIPTANTIIMNRADSFGLAQLHQLRGRVGRSHHQAYAYLLLEPHKKVTPQAEKRLSAIQQLEDLGAGFMLALHDLEIRGAGELLGDEQSGEIQEIGFHLYTEILKNAIEQLKTGKEPDLNNPLDITTEINLHTPALLPQDYCPDVHERLVIYKRLASTNDIETLNILKEELIDRFGLLPPSTNALLFCHTLRILVADLGITKIEASDTTIQFHFSNKTTINPQKVVQHIQQDPRCQMKGPDKLRIQIAYQDVSARVAFIRKVIEDLR